MNSLEVIQLEAYQTPEVIEDAKKEYVAFGTNNLFYDELIDVYLNSPTSHSTITGIVNQIEAKDCMLTMLQASQMNLHNLDHYLKQKISRK